MSPEARNILKHLDGMDITKKEQEMATVKLATVCTAQPEILSRRSNAPMLVI